MSVHQSVNSDNYEYAISLGEGEVASVRDFFRIKGFLRIFLESNGTYAEGVQALLRVKFPSVFSTKCWNYRSSQTLI